MTVELFITPGNYTWTAPVGVTSVTVECWGGGGCGGASYISGGGGGGAGGYGKKIISVTPGNNYDYQVGAGSIVDTSAATESNFIDSVTVAGREGGDGNIGSLPGGGTPGSGSTGTGTTIFKGGDGGYGSNLAGGGGGGSGGSASVGNVGGDASGSTPGTGGVAVTDGGAGGDGSAGGTAVNGFAPGGGGGGGGIGGVNANGADGQVKLTYELPASSSSSSIVSSSSSTIPSSSSTIPSSSSTIPSSSSTIPSSSSTIPSSSSTIPSSSCCGNVSLILSCYDPVTNTFKLEGSGGSFDLAIANCSPFSALFEGGVILDNCTIGSIVVNADPTNPFCSSSSSTQSNIDCCGTILPDTLTATITGCCTGSITLNFSVNRWTGSNTICGRTLTVSFCTDPNVGIPCECFSIYFEWSDGCGTPHSWLGTCDAAALTCTCSPFQVSTIADALVCCGGDVTITITI